MKKTLVSAAAMLMSLMLGSTVLRADDTVRVFGINPTASTSWYEQFEITIDPGKVSGKPKVTAKEIEACVVQGRAFAGGILVDGAVYTSIHAANAFVYSGGNPLFNAGLVSGYLGFSEGIADLSGDATHIWANPWNGTGKVYEFVPDADKKNKLGWKVKRQFTLAMAKKNWDGLEVFADKRLFANEEDAGFDMKASNPCSNSNNAIYDEYDPANGNLVKAGLIKTTFPASGIVFNGTYFLVSDICNNKIAVYDDTGKLIGEADLGALPAQPIACQAPPKSFCRNTNLKRCLEDLSLDNSPTGLSEQPSVQGPVPAAAREEMAPTLQLSGTPPVGVRAGETHSLTMSVQANGVGVPGAPVTFASVMGDVHFVSGQLSQEGRQSTVSADENGQATVQYVTGQPGLSIVEVTSTGASQRISISASNVGVLESH